jgi:hypothetical protein
VASASSVQGVAVSQTDSPEPPLSPLTRISHQVD